MEGRTLRDRRAKTVIRALRVSVVAGPDAGTTLDATTDRITIGTAAGNDLVLTDERVSRYHLELRRVDRGVSVVDHESTNGTAFANALLTSAIVPPNAELSIGRSKIRVEDGASVSLPLYEGDHFGGIVGRSPAMRQLMATVERAAKTNVTVLIVGETGVGKELVARALHEASPRVEAPFEIVDCAAQLPTLITSELLGHEKGAFTGAEASRPGAFERAHEGTVFLDEIGELPTSVQPTLLGVLERRAFKRLGGDKTRNVDVRVVCATNRDLRGEVNSGRFREDLYYRIGVVLLRVPPLRERPEDVMPLAEHFLRQLGANERALDVFGEEVVLQMKAHRWPGNVRELRNFVEAAYAIGAAPALAPGASARAASTDLLAYADARAAALHDFERAYVKRLLERAEGNVSEAARLANMNRGYLRRIIARHNEDD